MRVVLVTGCSSGIGLETAVAFAASGDRVYASMRDVSRADRLRARLDRAGLEAEVVSLDVTDPDAVDGVVRAIEDTHGRVDVAVNNAGVSIFEPIEYSTVEHWRLAVDTMLLGPVWVGRAVLPGMRARGAGCIVNVSSIAGRLASIPTQAAYAVTKHGLCAFSDALAAEAGGFGVRVHCVEPGFFATDIMAKGVELAVPESDPYHSMVAETHERFVEGLETAPGPAPVAQLIVAAADGRLGAAVHHPIGQPGATATATAARGQTIGD